MQLLRKKGLLDSPRVLFLPVDAISPNPNQPRRVFGTQELEELAGSIQALGLLQPLTVRRRADGWELVAGERRLRAAKLAGLEEVPCISLQIDDQRSSLLALVENLQRKDLDFWEEALALDRLISVYHLSQEEAARRIGKSQSAVANKLRLLKLPEDTLRALRDGGCTERHARALLRLEDPSLRQKALERLLRKVGVDNAALLYEMTVCYLEGGKFGRAEKPLDRLLKLCPEDESVQGLEERLTNGVMREVEEARGYGFDLWPGDDEEVPFRERTAAMPYQRAERKIGRNEPCPCGSGKKYKHCCGRNA